LCVEVVVSINLLEALVIGDVVEGEDYRLPHRDNQVEVGVEVGRQTIYNAANVRGRDRPVVVNVERGGLHSVCIYTIQKSWKQGDPFYSSRSSYCSC